MIYPKASAKNFKVKPWLAKNFGSIMYMAREGPAVFWSTMVAVAIGIPTAVMLLNEIKKEPRGTAHQKVYYTVVRPTDYPAELHKYCR